jgi:DNA-binding NarL/FixJ family response regulator
METPVKRVLLIDSHPLMLEALRRVAISVWPKIHAVEVDELSKIESGCRFGAAVDLVVMDPDLRGAIGLAALIMIRQRLPNTPVIVYTSRADDQIVQLSRAHGAAAYLHKSARLVELTDCLNTVAGGAQRFPVLKGSRGHEDLTAMRKRLDGLTSTQLKVLLNIADGRLNKQVAATLNVSEAAIKGHMTAIFRKLGVQNRSQAILAVRPLLAEGVAA